jgi:hypothetical protein
LYHMADDRPTPEQEVRRLYDEAEARTAKAVERVVARDSFGEVLAMATENTIALMRIGFDGLDLLWSNLRLAGRRDITRLSQRLARTEDKLELVLQEIEHLRDEAAPPRSGRSSGNGGQKRAQTRRGSTKT